MARTAWKEPTRDRLAALVDLGRVASETKTGKQWLLGDYAIEVAGPAKSVEDNDGRGGRLASYADQIGESYEDIASYRKVSTAWKSDTRTTSVIWTCFRELYSHEPVMCPSKRCREVHGFPEQTREQIMRAFVAHCEAKRVRPSYRRLQAFLGKEETPQYAKSERRAQAERALEDMDTAERAEVVAEAAKSDVAVATATLKTIAQEQPKAVDAALRDRKTRTALAAGEQRVSDEIARDNELRTEEATRTDPALRSLERLKAGLDLQHEVDLITRSADRIVRDILPRMGQLPEAQRDPLAMRAMLQSALNDCEAALEPIRTLLRTGKSDIDAFLADVLGGANG